jgi:hypothetical protein
LNSITPRLVQGVAKSMCISGTDIHVVGDASASAGYLSGGSIYWKNGTPTELTSPGQRSSANGIFVVGDDVYIAGSMNGTDGNPHAVYWKNGNVIALDPNYNSVAKAITVDGSNVYVVGERASGWAMLWTNGKASILGKGRARSITLKK